MTTAAKILRGLGWVLISTTGAGCRNAPPALPKATVDAPARDRLQDQYEKLRTADNDVDAAFGELDDASSAAKELAPKAGGEAEQALGSVVELLNGAGETLDDYEKSADTLADFKKDFAAQDERRIRSIKVINDALSKIADSSDILSDLGKNAPQNYQADVKLISDDVAQAAADLEDAVTGMGGQLADTEDSESVDPVQEKSKSP